MSYTVVSWQIGLIKTSKRAALLVFLLNYRIKQRFFDNLNFLRITFLAEMMHQPVFDYLRTKKALGYISLVSEWTRNGVGAIGNGCFIFISNQHKNTLYTEKLLRSSIIYIYRVF